MEKIHRDILREKRVELSEDLEPEILLKHMTKVLKSSDEEKIKAQSTRIDRVDQLLDILPRRGGRAFYCFLEALGKEQRHLADLLRMEEVTFERCNSANLRLQLNETKKELEREKEKNLTIQAENEELKKIQDEKLNKLHKQMLKTEDNLKQYIDKVLEKKAKDKLRSLQSQPSNQEDRSTSPIQQTASEDSKTCKKCEIVGQKYLDLQNTNTEEIQRLKNATMEYKDKINTLQNEILAQKSLNEQSKEHSKAQVERLQTFLNEKQTELLRLRKEVEKSRKKSESDEKKLAVLRRKNENLQEEIKQLLEDKKAIKEEKKKNEKEMAASKNIVSKVQKEYEVLETELEKWKSLPGKVLNFNKAFDRNGVIYTLSAKNQNFSLVAKRSSDAHGNPMDIFNHSTGTHSGTENKENSWWQIDLGEDVLLFPNHYALRHGRDNGLAFITNWKLEGSRDGNQWKVLREHKSEKKWFNKNQGTYPYCTGSWQIEGPIDAVRFLRIYQTGKNSAGDHALYLSGIEVYGVLLNICEGD